MEGLKPKQLISKQPLVCLGLSFALLFRDLNCGQVSFLQIFVIIFQKNHLNTHSNSFPEKSFEHRVDLHKLKQIQTMGFSEVYRGFPTRMVYLHYISCLRYTILVGNLRYGSGFDLLKQRQVSLLATRKVPQ